MGCHFIEWKGTEGYRFAVWAPNAKNISLAGEFNEWKGDSHPLERITKEGLWAGFFTDIFESIPYKYKIVSSTGQILMKSDPYAVQSELRPATASIVPDISAYEWNDKEDRKSVV